MATSDSPQLPGLTPQERDLLKKIFSSPLDIPPAFKSWLVAWLRPTLSLSLSQISGSENIPRSVTGVVNAVGTVKRGTGFSVSKLGTGEYLITLDTAFAIAPVVVATVDDNTGSTSVAQVANVNTTDFDVNVVDNVSGALADKSFHFIASQTL